ncbi:MAG: helix-turn-helix transcriptional regulator [Hespellia sp.]|nr:helix-turn-helix transcriptional regulator [Hespellia sp.]
MKKYQNIRNLREDKDLTQAYMAERLCITQRTYSRYENGDHYIPTEILIELADFHSVSVDYLLGLTAQKTPYPPKKK